MTHHLFDHDADAPLAPPVGMTEEQLHFFSEQTRRAVAKAIRRYRNGALVGFCVLLAGVGYGFHQIGSVQDEQASQAKAARIQGAQRRIAIVQSGRAVSVDGCNRDFRTITTLRSILTNAQNVQEKAAAAGDISQGQATRAKEYYAQQLAALSLPDCRNALNVVTADPNAPINVPVPLYPKG